MIYQPLKFINYCFLKWAASVTSLVTDPFTSVSSKKRKRFVQVTDLTDATSFVASSAMPAMVCAGAFNVTLPFA